jgi:hypothetical protein
MSGILILVRRKHFSLLQNVHDWPWGPSCLLFHVYRVFISEIKWSGRDFDHLSNAEVRNEWNYTSISRIRYHGVESDSFTFVQISRRRIIHRWLRTTVLYQQLEDSLRHRVGESTLIPGKFQVLSSYLLGIIKNYSIEN